MKKLSNRRKSIRSKTIKERLVLLCKIFVIWLLLQFFLQTFVTFKLNRDGKFWTIFWMWKEFILLIFLVTILRYFFTHLKTRIQTIKNKENCDKVTRKEIFKNIKWKFIFEYIRIFLATSLIFVILALLFQHIGIKALVLSIKYDLIWFFIFWIGVCLASLFFTEEDKDLLELYDKLIIRSLWLWLLWRVLWLLDMLPSLLKYAWFDPASFEWTVWANPPAAYYTKIKPFYEGSYVRNTYLFERPTSFWFWLVAFFPVFVLWFLRKKNRKDQLFPIIFFWLLVLSTRSRAWIVVRALEAIVLFFILFRRKIKKFFIPLAVLFIVWLWWVIYLWRWIMAREHSNTGHIVLMKAGWDIAKQNPIIWRWAWYAGPASHQLCYREHDDQIINNTRCAIIKNTNDAHEITTYGFNPENQYLQILIEYWVVGIIFWLALCICILRYSAKSIYNYRKKNKSPFQELLYYSLLWFWIWFIWLCIEWFVLHSLVDRMVIYPFFLLYWITVWLRENEKDKQYIPPQPKKKKKKKSESKSKTPKKKSK